jgi:hypothetical protein
LHASGNAVYVRPGRPADVPASLLTAAPPAGAIGNALWGGVALRDVLAAAGLDLSSAAAALAQGAEGREVVRHVVLKVS